jgi:purine-binding chemotaxis protein CheW
MQEPTMRTDATANARPRAEAGQYVSFYLGEDLFGVPIGQVDEINRHLDLTPVPHAPAWVRGVINLRGAVVSVVDLRSIPGLSPAGLARASRNVIVHFGSEHVGLLVDRVADVVSVPAGALDPPPASLRGTGGRFFCGVYKLDSELMAILDIEAALGAGSLAV